MDEPTPDNAAPPSDPQIDLGVLEHIEEELAAVERALEQIDQGVYEGFAGIDDQPA